MYRDRRDAMMQALHDFMPAACTWNPRTAGSSSGSRCPRASTPRRCCPARSPPGRLRARHRVLRRRLRLVLDAPVVLLPHARAHPGGRPPLAGVLEAGDGSVETFGASAPSHELCRGAGTTPRARPTKSAPPLRPPTRAHLPGAGAIVNGPRRPGCPGRRALPRAGRLAALRAPGAEALRGSGVDVAERDVDASLLPCPDADPPACVVPMLHGETGEDGAIREVLEPLDPVRRRHAEPPPHAFDKPVAKMVVAARRAAHPGVGLPAPRDLPRARRGRRDGLAGRQLGLPLMVKPARSGSASAAPSWRPPTSCPAPWSTRSPTAPSRCWSSSSRASRSPSRSSTTGRVRARCPRWGSSRTAGSTTTPRATPPGGTEFNVPAGPLDEATASARGSPGRARGLRAA